MIKSILPLRAVELGYIANARTLLNGISLTINRGTFTVVLGPNGAGKSLLLRLLHGMLEPSTGTISWGNGSSADRRRRQAMVFQRPVHLRRSVEANIAFALGALGIPRKDRSGLVQLALERAGLTAARRVHARLLSVGEQQRLSVARALAAEPDILFLDEPTASLDPVSVHRIETLLIEANARGTAIVLVTHDVSQARRVGQKIVFLHDGRINGQGPAPSFLDNPNSDVARAYLAGKIIV